MNILGEGFDPKILGQIDARQKVIASGYLNNNPRTSEFITYATSATSYLRLMSSTTIENIQVLNSPYIKSLNLTGNTLAKEAILFGGVQSYQGPLKGGILNDNSTDPLNNFAYGWGGTQFGLRPMPGIISANIKAENIGSLKTSIINIKAYTQAQFEIIDALYLRLGFYVLLEWGHTRHINNDGELVKEVPSLQNEFFSDGASVDGLLASIVQKRYSSFGNYDAILGKVVNFDWTFEKDGTYSITVMVRSIGDVIETIKANVFTNPKEISNIPLVQQVSTNPAYQKQQVIQSSRQYAPSSVTDRLKSNIHYRLYSLQDYLDSQTTPTNYEFSVNTYLSDDKLKDIARVIWKGSSDPIYYVRFGALLRLIEGEVIPTVYKGNDKYKLINIDYDADTNIINYLDAQLSADPRNVLIKRSFNTALTKSDILPNATDYAFPIDKVGTYGKLMNVYISYDYLFGLLDNNKNVGSSKVSLISFLQQIGQTISGALGGINSIVPVIDEDTNTVRFIDQNLLYKKDEVINYFNGLEVNKVPLLLKKIPTQRGVFDLFGYNPSGSAGSGSAGFIKDFTLKTELTPQFASMITIGAAARSRVVGEDATALSRLNKGLTTSLFEEINDANILPADDADDYMSSLDEQYKDTVPDYVEFVKAMDMSGQKPPSWTEADVDTYPSVLNSFIRYTQQVAYEKEGAASTSTGFIPINMSLTMTGLSGMKIYQEFTINTSYLPTNYSQEMTFIIKGVNHTIQNNVWSTTVETLSLPKITTKPKEEQASAQSILNKPGGSTTDEGNPIPISYLSIVEKIIKAAVNLGVTDKSRLIAILTVAQAETRLVATAKEGNKLYSLARAKQVFAKQLKGKTDVEIRNIFSNPESTYNFLYGGRFGNKSNEGYKYRGRGFSQITFKDNYTAVRNLLNGTLGTSSVNKLTNQPTIKTNISSYDIVSNPDLAATEELSILILILGKINGTFGNKLNLTTNYAASPLDILKTQNRAANNTILTDYSRALNSINRTKWIQDLLDKI